MVPTATVGVLSARRHGLGDLRRSAMLGVGGWLVVQAWGDRSDPGAPREEAGRALLAAATIFAVSLAFRSIDLAVCPRWPLGTHVAWHGLNAVVLFLLVRAAIVFRARDASCVG